MQNTSSTTSYTAISSIPSEQFKSSALDNNVDDNASCVGSGGISTLKKKRGRSFSTWFKSAASVWGSGGSNNQAGKSSFLSPVELEQIMQQEQMMWQNQNLKKSSSKASLMSDKFGTFLKRTLSTIGPKRNQRKNSTRGKLDLALFGGVGGGMSRLDEEQEFEGQDENIIAYDSAYLSSGPATQQNHRSSSSSKLQKISRKQRIDYFDRIVLGLLNTNTTDGDTSYCGVDDCSPGSPNKNYEPLLINWMKCHVRRQNQTHDSQSSPCQSMMSDEVDDCFPCGNIKSNSIDGDDRSSQASPESLEISSTNTTDIEPQAKLGQLCVMFPFESERNLLDFLNQANGSVELAIEKCMEEKRRKV